MSVYSSCKYFDYRRAEYFNIHHDTRHIPIHFTTISRTRSLWNIWTSFGTEKCNVCVIMCTACLSINITNAVLGDIGRTVFFTFRLSYGFIAYCNIFVPIRKTQPFLLRFQRDWEMIISVVCSGYNAMNFTRIRRIEINSHS